MKKVLINSVFVVGTILTFAVIESCTDGRANPTVIPKASEPIPVKVVNLERSLDQQVIHASGQLTTEDETILGFKTGGIVSAVFVKEGDRVRQGQLLAKLDLTEIKAQVSQARHGYEKAQRDFNRVTNLHRDSVATLEQLQNAATGLAVAREQLDAASFNLSYSEIHAIADGFVLKKFVNQGQVVGVGDPILLTNGAGNGKWILKTGVSDRQWTSIKVNDVASVAIDAFPDREFKAIVLRKSESADQRTGAFTLELQLQEKEKFAAGMFGSAKIITSQRQNFWSVPYEAVLDANDNEGFVFITTDLKTASKKPVVIDSFNGSSVRISRGLEEGGALIVSGSAYLSDLSPITIIK